MTFVHVYVQKVKNQMATTSNFNKNLDKKLELILVGLITPFFLSSPQGMNRLSKWELILILPGCSFYIVNLNWFFWTLQVDVPC